MAEPNTADLRQGTFSAPDARLHVQVLCALVGTFPEARDQRFVAPKMCDTVGITWLEPKRHRATNA